MRRRLVKAIGASSSRALAIAGVGACTCICAGRCLTSTARLSVERPVGADRHHSRRRRHPAHLRGDRAGRAVRPRLRARAGSALADGVPAPHRPRPPVGDFRRRHRSPGSLPSHRRLRPRRADRLGRRCRHGRRQQVNAYVAGVNAFIATHQGARLPPEFTLLRFEPEPWSGVDVIVWVKMMAWDLSANYSFELLRDDLVRAVGVERMAAADAAVRRGRPEHRAVHRQARTTKDTEDAEATDAGRSEFPPPCPLRPPWWRAHQPRGSSAALFAALSGGVPRGSRLSAGRRPERIARLEQLGRRRHADRDRQAAARQRPASRDASFRPPGISRICRPATST